MSHLLWQPVAEIARRIPERIAVRGDGRSITYDALWATSGNVAAHLEAHGVGRGQRVGIVLLKAPECIIAMLGVLRTGATYVPVDPRAPAARQAYVLGNAAVSAAPAPLEQVGAHRGERMPRLTATHGVGASPSWMSAGSSVTLDALPLREPRVEGGGANEGEPAYTSCTPQAPREIRRASS